ncbi:reactive mitochondrial oxygen species modulator 1 domain-containing protein [Trichoderma aethiopicum]
MVRMRRINLLPMPSDQRRSQWDRERLRPLEQGMEPVPRHLHSRSSRRAETKGKFNLQRFCALPWIRLFTMPPVAPIHHGGQQAPSTFDKLKMGAMMGGSVGVIMGFIFGTVNIFRYGAGQQGIMRTLGQYMGASGATFGFVQPEAHFGRLDADRVTADSSWELAVLSAPMPTPNYTSCICEHSDGR